MSPNYVFCDGVADHTLFSCGRWDGFHQQLYVRIGELSAVRN